MPTPQRSSAEEGDRPPILQTEKLSPRVGKLLSQALETRTQGPQPLPSPPTSPVCPWPLCRAPLGWEAGWGAP